MTQNQMRQALKDAYLIDFPDDLFQFWDFTRSFGADEPLATFWSGVGLSSGLGLYLEGPFRIIAGETQSEPRNDWYLDSRYYNDPPEFFTVFSGDSDWQHWGYWLDDPDNTPSYSLADFYSNDAFEITEDGDTLFEAFRLRLEECHHNSLVWLEEDPISQDSCEASLEDYALFRSRLMHYATGERPEIGDEYTKKYAGLSRRAIVADTLEGMGIVVPEPLYRPLSLNDQKLLAKEYAGDDMSGVVAEAERALAEGYPGTALKLGRDLWIGSEQQKQDSYRLLSSAYEALNRPTLQTLLARIATIRKK